MLFGRLIYALLVLVWMTALLAEGGISTSVLRLQQDSSAGGTCTLECPEYAPCRHGSADFSGHALQMESSYNGMHCDCPMGE